MTARPAKFAWSLALIAPLALTACHGPAQPVTKLMTADPDEWPSWGRTGSETHYSPLDTIDADNVSGLKLAWHFDLEPGYTASTPLMAEGKVFITSGHSHIRAFYAETGKLLWEYDGGTRERATSSLQMTWGNKGIAYDKTPDGKGHVFLVTTDGYVISLDAATGKEDWKTYDYPDNAPRNSNGAPRVFGGKVITGFGGADISPARAFVTAYDEATGKRLWRFYTTPGDEVTPANRQAEAVMRETWPSGWKNEDGTRRGGGGTAWNAFSYDPDLGLIYIGVGNGFPYNRDKRSPGGGDNLFLASIVAVDADTGEYKWHYQVCPGEQWDCTATTDMTLATLKIDGKERKVLMQAPKNGFFYVLDRKTGELLNPPGKIAKVTWADRIGMKTGRPVENPGIRYNGKPGMFELWPGPTGAHSWMPQAYSPDTGLVYIPVLENGALIGDGMEGGGEITRGMGVTLIPEVDLPGGHRSFLKAWDPVTQTEAWRVKLPGSWPGGVMTTAGGLVFEGQIDGKFAARDAKTGKELWSFKAVSPIVGAPITYRMNGKQYVTVITGSGGQGAGMQTLANVPYHTDYRLPRRVLTFTLDGKDTLPPFTYTEPTPPADPDYQPDAKRSQAGFMVFAGNACLVCHGWNAVGGGAAPDLRYSPAITDAQTFRAIVKEGGLKMNGMPPFSGISSTDLENLRFYLRTRAQQAPAEKKAMLNKLKAAKAATAKPQDFPGKWNIVIQSPMGPQKAVLDLKVNGHVVTGTATAEQGSVDLAGAFKNGRIKIEGKASMPMPITVAYDLTVKDGELQGENSNGPFGTFPVTGTH
ncbi:outer membrane protein assembly factor BamB family protein [Novosphingobium beihaiensis]|uniref:PQQ-binding-like beta-propeller repeat protein n=1 Tax=Novosphingobium beihaiensis TaxID=2930389 RepID=A0ABT0BSP7_9SPHN|nr:PQQ-binding-like beta-propeller repeat protein [Novosphingobium beihaiensis]MCJ2188075.1 PQQ-binding-like beta-propeller repeat protein [Novosphingobium beihaiensis]